MARKNLVNKAGQSVERSDVSQGDGVTQGQTMLDRTNHYMAMHWNTVRKLAVERGIPVLGRKKGQLVKDLVIKEREA